MLSARKRKKNERHQSRPFRCSAYHTRLSLVLISVFVRGAGQSETPLGARRFFLLYVPSLQMIGRSCILLYVGNKRIMLDCGMHMGFNDQVSRVVA